MALALIVTLNQDIDPYQSWNYIGTLITTSPNSDQVDCPSAAECPKWNNQAIYLADYPGVAGEGAMACDDSTSASNVSPGMIAVSKAVRMSAILCCYVDNCKCFPSGHVGGLCNFLSTSVTSGSDGGAKQASVQPCRKIAMGSRTNARHARNL